MADPDLIGLFIAPLERIRLSYMITGGVASVIYGDPRFTRDIDLVVALRRSDVARLATAFPGERFYLPPAEVLEEAAARSSGGHFNVIDRETALRADIYLKGDDPLHAWAFDRRRRLPVEEIALWVAPVEYVIVRKLEYHRASGSERHLRDVAMMLDISGDLIDRAALDSWIETLDLGESFGEASRYEP